MKRAFFKIFKQYSESGFKYIQGCSNDLQAGFMRMALLSNASFWKSFKRLWSGLCIMIMKAHHAVSKTYSAVFSVLSSSLAYRAYAILGCMVVMFAMKNLVTRIEDRLSQTHQQVEMLQATVGEQALFFDKKIAEYCDRIVGRVESLDSSLHIELASSSALSAQRAGGLESTIQDHKHELHAKIAEHAGDVANRIEVLDTTIRNDIKHSVEASAEISMQKIEVLQATMHDHKHELDAKIAEHVGDFTDRIETLDTKIHDDMHASVAASTAIAVQRTDELEKKMNDHKHEVHAKIADHAYDLTDRLEILDDKIRNDLQASVIASTAIAVQRADELEKKMHDHKHELHAKISKSVDHAHKLNDNMQSSIESLASALSGQGQKIEEKITSQEKIFEERIAELHQLNKQHQNKIRSLQAINNVLSRGRADVDQVIKAAVANQLELLKLKSREKEQK